MMVRTFTLVVLLAFPCAWCFAGSSQEEDVISINDALCLVPEALSAEIQNADLLSYRRLARHFQSCADDEASRLRYLELASKNGSTIDVMRYAAEVEELRGVQAAFEIYLRAAKKGDRDSQVWVATALEKQGGDGAEIVGWLESAARQGDWAAMARLGERITKEEPAMALAWLTLAAERAPVRRAHDIRANVKERTADLSQRQAELLEELVEELAETIPSPERR